MVMIKMASTEKDFIERDLTEKELMNMDIIETKNKLVMKT